MKHFFQYLPAYASLGLLWLLHWLPLPLLRLLGALLGIVLYLFAWGRARIGRTNLRLCFPHWRGWRREWILLMHFIVLACSILERGLLWWAPRARLERLITVNGLHHLNRDDGQPTIMLAPHFVGLDAGAVGIALRSPGRGFVSVYSTQKNPVFDAVFVAGRLRFTGARLLSRQEGMRRVLKAMKEGYAFYYLPDMDFGRTDSIFVPFFGIQAATITGASRLVRITGAKIVPCVTRMVPGGYVVDLLPPLENVTGEDLEKETLSMNQWIETQVLTMPAQYYWLHRRFKTRPAGEPRIY